MANSTRRSLLSTESAFDCHFGRWPHHMPQVCLAAEKCGHVGFDSRSDMWWGHEGMQCGDTLAGDVTFSQVFWKVRHACLIVYSTCTRNLRGTSCSAYQTTSAVWTARASSLQTASATTLVHRIVSFWGQQLRASLPRALGARGMHISHCQ